jgi:FkbM family methyltransferase
MPRPYRLKLVALLERGAAALRRIGLGGLVDRIAPRISIALGSFTAEVDGVLVHGATIGHQHYVRELLEGNRERTLIDLIRAALPAGGVAVDGGAYLGYVTLQLARAVGPSGRVFAFEPDPRSLEVLRRNVAANEFERVVEIVPAALGSTGSTADFYLSEAGDTSGLFSPVEPVATARVEVVRGDDVLVDVPMVDLVKLDLEGGETAALAGLERVLERSERRVTVVAECNPALLAAAGSSSDELITRLEQLGFVVAWIDEASAVTVPVRRRRWTADYVNLYCVR